MSNSIQEFEAKLNVLFPPLFRQHIAQGTPLQSENSEFYTLNTMNEKFTDLESYAGKKGLAIGDWGTGDAYVLLLQEHTTNELDETIYLYDEDLNQVSAFSESIETLLDDERDFFE